jgi:hypothetical protein
MPAAGFAGLSASIVHDPGERIDCRYDQGEAARTRILIKIFIKILR